MTHIDDQVAKHIRDMLRRVMQKPDENEEKPTRSDTLNQVVQILRRAPDCPYDLIGFIRVIWDENNRKTLR